MKVHLFIHLVGKLHVHLQVQFCPFNLTWDLTQMYMCFSVDGSNSEDRTTEEELPMLHTSTPGPFKFCSPDLQVGGFCEKPEDQSNDDELCKMSQWLCQSTKIIMSIHYH